MVTDARTVVGELEARLRPLEVALSRAWWDTNVDATEEHEAARRRIELELRDVLADRDAFEEVRQALDDGLDGGRDALVRRQLEVVHAAMAPNQLAADLRERLVALELEVERRFNTHRGELAGERADDNRIAEVLRDSRDGELRRAAWEASKSVGAEVADLVLDLVRLRNEAARSLGYADHYRMALALGELDEERLLATLDEVETVTDAPFRAWKAGHDEANAARFGIGVDELRPWHEADVFFQEAPVVDAVDLDAHFAGCDLEALTVRSYDGIGIDVRPVLARSDLYGREGKSQHAFCIDIDREGDVRVLCNVVANERWAETMLHEFGHAAYDIGLSPDLPYLLRHPAHMLTTEAVAMLFGRLSRDPAWLRQVAGMDPEAVERAAPALRAARRASGLVFVRWALVMCHFERGLYRDPDADHDTRWWDLVERFQLVRRPEGRRAPDWAAKIHLAVAPVYYQNYLLGELLAAQLQAALVRDVGGVVDRPAAGDWLRSRVFGPGDRSRWDRLVHDATGEPLTARHFAVEVGSAGR